MSGVADVASTVLFNRSGELRSGWRVLVFLVLFSICITLLVTLADLTVIPAIEQLRSPLNDAAISQLFLIRPLFEQTLSLGSVLVASAVSARVLEHRSLGSIGYKLHSGWWRDCLLGLALGTAAIALAVAIATTFSALEFEWRNAETVTLLTGLLGLFIFFAISAAFEELLVRGFVFQALARDISPVAALVITSVGFALLHLRNPEVSIFALANTILAGVWLGVAYLKTRSLWLATALHTAWNFSMAYLFGLPVSGLTAFSQSGVLLGLPETPLWISGGSYGPEGGAAATLTLIVSTVIIWKGSMFQTAEEMLIRK